MNHSEQNIKMTIENLNAWFGSFQALYDIAMTVPAKTVTAVIGPSGCGKSTFVRCLNRLHETVATAKMKGFITLDGKNIMEKDTVLLRRQVGMVFQKPNPFPTLSIFDNVAVGLKLNGVRDRRVIHQRVEESLKRAALWDEVKDKLQDGGLSISGGQQQRLCIARALAVNPEVLLMDEPCSALDPISTARVEELIHELKNNYTIVIVTHNMQQAGRVSDFTGFFLMGKLVEHGKTADLFTNPKETKTEEYITGRFG